MYVLSLSMESILVLELHCKGPKGEEESVQKRAVRFVTLNYSYNNNEKVRSFKSKENIHKKKVGPYRGFGY